MSEGARVFVAALDPDADSKLTYLFATALTDASDLNANG
jgi:hypothetical protein